MTRCRARRYRRQGRTFAAERGTAVVEFAIVLPVLAMLIMGIFTGGFAYNNKQQITLAAREGARFGATLAQDQCATPSDCGGFNWAQLVQDVTVKRSAGSLSTAGVCVALVSGPGTAPVAVDSTHTTAGGTNACYVDNSSDSGKRVQVKVWRSDRLDAVVYSTSLTLNASAMALFEP
jgi:Flp pilus assembly protein TadG